MSNFTNPTWKNIHNVATEVASAVEFSNQVDKYVKEHYGLNDGGDLCYHYLATGDIKFTDSISTAASIVAQNLTQL